MSDYSETNLLTDLKFLRVSTDSFPRSNLHQSAAISPLRVCQVTSHRLLSELSNREKNLRKMLQGETFQYQYPEISRRSLNSSFCDIPFVKCVFLYRCLPEPVNEASALEIVLSHTSSAATKTGTSLGHQKRKYDTAFPESTVSSSTSHDPPPLLYSSKKPFPADRGLCAASMYSSDSLSQNPHTGPGYSRLLDTSVHHMVGLRPSHYSLLLPGLHAQYQTVSPP